MSPPLPEPRYAVYVDEFEHYASEVIDAEVEKKKFRRVLEVPEDYKQAYSEQQMLDYAAAARRQALEEATKQIGRNAQSLDAVSRFAIDEALEIIHALAEQEKRNE